MIGPSSRLPLDPDLQDARAGLLGPGSGAPTDGTTLTEPPAWADAWQWNVDRVNQAVEAASDIPTLLEPAPNTDYGGILPVARDQQTGNLRIALPSGAREFLKGVYDLSQGPRTGEVTPEGTMALFDLASGGVLSRRDPSTLASITPGRTQAGEVLSAKLNPNAPGFNDRISTRVPSAVQVPDIHLRNDHLVDADSFNVATRPGRDGTSYQDKTAVNIGWMPGFERYKPQPNFMSPDVNAAHEDVVNHFVDNLRALYFATDEKWRPGAMNWYDGANKLAIDLAQEYGLEPRAAAGILAALSPQKDWNENVEMARRVAMVMGRHHDKSVTPEMSDLWQTKYNQKYELNADGSVKLNKKGQAVENENYKGEEWASNWAALNAQKEGGLPVTLADIPSDQSRDLGLFIRLFDEAHNPTGRGTRVSVVKPDGTYGRDLDAPLRWNTNNFLGNAASIFRDGSRENISITLGDGHKVRNFYNNIISPNAGSDVTIDTHAIAAANLLPWGSGRPEVAYGLGTSSPTKAYRTEGFPTTPAAGADNGSLGLYPLYAEAYRRLADELGLLPRQVQSVTWEGIKGLYSDTDRRNNALIRDRSDLWRAFENGSSSRAETQTELLRRGITAPEWTRGG